MNPVRNRNLSINMAKVEVGYTEIDPSGRYGRFKEVLGKGATKTVYRAFDELRGMEVAWNQVKLNDFLRSPEEMQRLYSEVHLLSTLHHESIIRYFASWINLEKRTFNFITEMFTSGTLREYRQRYKRVHVKVIKNWARQILLGLVYLHNHKSPVVHRDLKCDNIFVNGHLGQVKIGDLGLAAILQGSKAAHSVIGTPEFMAPELYEEEYNELVDIYSFGMCVLEMLTSEYPYGECSNPAQIYKKVTSGKLPDAFYRIKDVEARRFIQKCLEKAPKRATAQQLLLDPFIHTDEIVPASIPEKKVEMQNTCSNSTEEDNLQGGMDNVDDGDGDDDDNENKGGNTDMTITGKRNPEDDTIFLKVRIADKDGCMRNIHFHFDTVSDTPLDVATEMVKELEITDKDPVEIAQVIEKEISSLILDTDHHCQSFSYEEEDEEDDDVIHSISPASSSRASIFDVLSQRRTRHGNGIYQCDWIQDNLFHDDETGSHFSYSDLNYSSSNELESDSVHSNGEDLSFSKDPRKHSHSFSRVGHSINDHHIFSRNHSMVDMRTQLVQCSLIDEMAPRRMFRTVGAVENIGFRSPFDIPSNVTLQSSLHGYPLKMPSLDGRKKGCRGKKR